MRQKAAMTSSNLYHCKVALTKCPTHMLVLSLMGVIH
jgi:hypothetical protein